MRRLQGCLLALALLAPSVGRCELISVFTPDANGELLRPFVRSEIFGVSGPGLATEFHSRWVSFTTELDTVADTARIKEATFDYRPLNASKTTSVPRDFPNPPTQITETITFDPVSIVTPLVSSEAGGLRFREGTLYETDFDIELSFPDEFRLTGTYIVQGPTQSVTVPFNARFLRGNPNPNVENRVFLRVDTGTNFPDSASVTLPFVGLHGQFYVATVATQTIFQGTIDGVMVNARFTDVSGDAGERFAAQLWLNQLIPEPSSGLLAATAVAAIGALVRRSSRRRGQTSRQERTATTQPAFIVARR
jgi:hypothetical protein